MTGELEEALRLARETLDYVAQHTKERGEDHFCEDFGCSSVEPLASALLAEAARADALEKENERLHEVAEDWRYSDEFIGKVVRSRFSVVYPSSTPTEGDGDA